MKEENKESESHNVVLIKSVEPEEGTPIVKGYDFDKGINYDSLIDSFQVKMLFFFTHF